MCLLFGVVEGVAAFYMVLTLKRKSWLFVWFLVFVA
jgi:hypothetical protein